MFSTLAVAAETALMMMEPAYRTYKTMITSNNDMQWIFIHWIVYSVFRVVDCLTEHWCPMHSVVKLITIIWLRMGGSEKLYRSVIQPFLNEHEPSIDSWLSRYTQVIVKQDCNCHNIDDNDDIGVKNDEIERADIEEIDSMMTDNTNFMNPNVVDITQAVKV